MGARAGVASARPGIMPAATLPPPRSPHPKELTTAHLDESIAALHGSLPFSASLLQGHFHISITYRMPKDRAICCLGSAPGGAGPLRENRNPALRSVGGSRRLRRKRRL